MVDRKYRTENPKGWIHGRLAPLLIGALTLLLTACGSAGGPGGVGSTNPDTFTGSTSQTCSGATGVQAYYWDFMLGTIRTDYPQTYRFLPYVGPAFIHPQQPLYSFTYPPGWNAITLTDPSLQLMGANVLREDGQALWRRLNLTVSGLLPASDFVAQELNTMAANLGASGPFEVICTASAGGPAERTEAAARLVKVGDFTANLNIQVFRSELLGGNTVAFIQLAVAPSAQFDAAALNVFFPLSGQMLPGGSSAPADCEDGEDNDGDGQTDYPDDKGCEAPTDDSEAGG